MNDADKQPISQVGYFGIGVNKGEAHNVNVGQTINNYSKNPELAATVTAIQQLLQQLEQSNPGVTETEQIVYVNEETTPSFKRRAASALQVGGETAIDEFILDNKHLKVVKAIIKGWLQPGS
ncbi:hypothetical protein [Leptolyngbya sp. AN10]|uniref:hypothetical protein n=1 Tax=Leptolyngbya sp. AN10 TaxID=3423365 RepID=UPI003D323293